MSPSAQIMSTAKGEEVDVLGPEFGLPNKEIEHGLYPTNGIIRGNGCGK